MAQQQQFAGRVHVTALPAPGVPRITDFDAIDRGRNVVVTRATDDLAGGQLAHRPRKHMPLLLTGERFANVRLCLTWLRYGREPQLPKFAIGRGGRQLVVMLVSQRLQPNSESFKVDRLNYDHSSILLFCDFLYPRAT